MRGQLQLRDVGKELPARRTCTPLDKAGMVTTMTLNNGGYSKRDLQKLTFLLTRELRTVRDLLMLLPVSQTTPDHLAWVNDMLAHWEGEYNAVSDSPPVPF